MKQKMKSNQGITLIALVITIIVLLILAAVTIATLTGENGILSKATTAKENTETEEEKEQIRLAYATALANDPNKLSVSAEELQKELEKLTSIEKIEGEEYFLSVQFTKTGNKYGIDGDGGITPIGKGEVTPKPEDSWETLASQITTENYGDDIAYDIDLDNDSTTNDWKIFYKDGNRVFLIAAKYIDYTINGDKLDLEKTKLKNPYEKQGGKYTLTWEDDLPSIESATDGIKSTLFKATKYDVTDSNHSNDNNAKCVSALLNTNNWTGFVNKQYADYAIGGPTLEMWVDSWNAKGTLKGKDKYINLDISPSESDYGYKINSVTKGVSLSTSTSSEDQTGYYDELYFPYREAVHMIEGIGSNGTADYETYGYWLASPSATDEASTDAENRANYLCGVGCHNGYLASGGYHTLFGIRPVVSLNVNIKAKNELGIWKLTE